MLVNRSNYRTQNGAPATRNNTSPTTPSPPTTTTATSNTTPPSACLPPTTSTHPATTTVAAIRPPLLANSALVLTILSDGTIPIFTLRIVMSHGMGNGSQRRLSRMRSRMAGSFGAGRPIILTGSMIGDGRMKVNSPTRACNSQGTALKLLDSGCDGRCNSTEPE